MCGITGFLDPSGLTLDELADRAWRMTDSLTHRGPDDRGIWTDAAVGLALGHRRLSILDLSEQGHQPMASACRRFCLVFNGEIYNHRELRRELEADGQRFRGHADTEVLVQAIARWGVNGAVRRLLGIFAFAVWDRESRQLTVVRDALGVKPLYYGRSGRCFLFGSELKALRRHPAFSAEVDRQALTQYLRHGYVPAPRTIYREVRQLPPGTLLTVAADAGAQRAAPTPWWSLQEAAERGLRDPLPGSAAEATAELERVLREAVRLQMEADVPLGAFLSGGVDSSVVVALMQTQSTQRVKTFSIGFEEPGYDEAPYARAVAQHLGTEHTEYYVSAAEARDVIPRLPHLYDEPFADSSQIPTCLVSQLARRHVTVCLSGDGGDELFCGYDRYSYLGRWWRRFAWCPRAVRRRAARAARLANRCGVPGRWRQKLQTLGELLERTDGQDFYLHFNTHWRQPQDVVVGSRLDDPPPTPLGAEPHLWQQMMYLDARRYLPDDVLVKVDRASMAVGLEVRVPLLEQRVVELAWRLPLSLKVRDGQTKWVLRRVLEQHVPPRLTERPKMGFGVPLETWLRGPLRPWAEALLEPRRLRDEGYFHPEPIRARWQEHLSGTRNWQYLLWDVLMFQAWLEAGGKEGTAGEAGGR